MKPNEYVNKFFGVPRRTGNHLCLISICFTLYELFHFTSILHGLIRTHKLPAPNVSGFIAQLVRASHRYREVTGSNPIEVLTFSSCYTQLRS